mmetsp:Transcript_77948/g.137433  ORF Transcript_77948/g.137433 Transcript_77948/m.137433 type:complete len:87 (+) Transcript_77948:95-355(+)
MDPNQGTLPNPGSAQPATLNDLLGACPDCAKPEPLPPLSSLSIYLHALSLEFVLGGVAHRLETEYPLWARLDDSPLAPHDHHRFRD